MKTRNKLGLAALAAMSSVALGQVDNVVSVIAEDNATGGKAIGSFGYDPTTDSAYVSSFGFVDGNAATIRKVTSVSNVGGQVSTGLLSETQLQLYYRDGDVTRGVTNPTQNALLLNPLPVTTAEAELPAYSFAVIQDAALTRLPLSTNVTDPAATKRFYRWNLQAPPPASPTPPPFGDGRDVITTISTLAEFQTLAGTTNTTNNVSRQFAYSGNGQAIYAIDTSTAFDGLYRIDLTNNTETRLTTGFTDSNTEPAVTTAGGVDTIYFRGGTSNLGGIDKITYDGATLGTRQVHVSGAAINDFLEITNGSYITTFSMTSDADGNLYFNDTDSGRPGGTPTSARRGTYRLDTEGRLVKVSGYEERRAVFGSLATGGNPNSNTLKMQVRETTFGSGSAAFAVRQLLYAEASGVNAVAGVYLFKTGDFNRDDQVDQADIALFKSALTLRGVTLSGIVAADQPKLRFDLNGNNEVSWKDVKILQQFYGFLDGDADINKIVNIDDFGVLAANFNSIDRKWTEGDFTGDQKVDIDDFGILAANFNQSAPGALLGRPAAVPEPALAGLAMAFVAMARRRR